MEMACSTLVFPGGGRFAGPGDRNIVGYPTRIFKNLGNFVFQDVTEEVLPEKEQARFTVMASRFATSIEMAGPIMVTATAGGLYRNVAAGKDEVTGRQRGSSWK